LGLIGELLDFVTTAAFFDDDEPDLFLLRLLAFSAGVFSTRLFFLFAMAAMKYSCSVVVLQSHLFGYYKIRIGNEFSYHSKIEKEESGKLRARRG
jgi:hypothetical protein